MEFLMENYITCDSLKKFPPMHLYFYVFPLFLIHKFSFQCFMGL